MPNMPSPDLYEWVQGAIDVEREINDAVAELRRCVHAGEYIPEDLYARLEDLGLNVTQTILQLEKETNGESDLYDPYWGC